MPLARRAQLAVVAHIRHTYTDYDTLLRTASYQFARRFCANDTLHKLVEWRGDDENGKRVLEDVFREVIVISDDEEDSDPDEDYYSPSVQEDSVEVISIPSNARADELRTNDYDDGLTTVQGLSSDEEAPPNFRVLPHTPRKTNIDHRDLTRYQAWDRAISQYRERNHLHDPWERARIVPQPTTIDQEPIQEAARPPVIYAVDSPFCEQTGRCPQDRALPSIETPTPSGTDGRRLASTFPVSPDGSFCGRDPASTGTQSWRRRRLDYDDVNLDYDDVRHACPPFPASQREEVFPRRARVQRSLPVAVAMPHRDSYHSGLSTSDDRGRVLHRVPIDGALPVRAAGQDVTASYGLPRTSLDRSFDVHRTLHSYSPGESKYSVPWYSASTDAYVYSRNDLYSADFVRPIDVQPRSQYQAPVPSRIFRPRHYPLQSIDAPHTLQGNDRNAMSGSVYLDRDYPVYQPTSSASTAHPIQTIRYPRPTRRYEVQQEDYIG